MSEILKQNSEFSLSPNIDSIRIKTGSRRIQTFFKTLHLDTCEVKVF